MAKDANCSMFHDSYVYPYWEQGLYILISQLLNRPIMKYSVRCQDAWKGTVTT